MMGIAFTFILQPHLDKCLNGFLESFLECQILDRQSIDRICNKNRTPISEVFSIDHQIFLSLDEILKMIICLLVSQLFYQNLSATSSMTSLSCFLVKRKWYFPTSTSSSFLNSRREINILPLFNVGNEKGSTKLGQKEVAPPTT